MKRANGEGSVFKRGRDGRWVARLAWVLPSGQLKRVERVRRTKRDAWQALADLQRLRDAGMLRAAADQWTLGRWLDHWVDVVLEERVAAGTLASTTAGSYRGAVERWVRPKLGRRRLDQLSKADVQWLLATLGGEGVGARGRQYAHAVLRAALSAAVDAEVLQRNVATLVKPAKPRRERIVPLEVEEARRLLEGFAGDRLGSLFTVALAIGLRPGEATGLEWSRVDLDAGAVEVSRNLVRVDGRWQLNDTKGHDGAVVPLPAFAVRALRDHRRLQAEERLAAPAWAPARGYDVVDQAVRDLDLVWTTTAGRPLWPSSVQDALAAACARAGVRRLTPHGLRHGGATLMLAQGTTTETIRATLRHSSITVTEGYAHVLEQAQRDAAERMDAQLG